MPPRVHRSVGRDFDLPFLPRRYDRAEAILPLQMMYLSERTSIFAEKPKPEDTSFDYVSMLHLFSDLAGEDEGQYFGSGRGPQSLGECKPL